MIIEFNVGRLQGWDSIYDLPHALGWDMDYKQLVKVDLANLTAISYVAVDPGNHASFAYQVIDACDIYLYLFFRDSVLTDIWKIFKIYIPTMTVVKYAEFPHLGYYQISGATADSQWIYLTHPGDVVGEGMIILPASLDDTQYTSVYAIPPFQGDMMGSPPGGDRGIKVDPFSDTIWYCGGNAASCVNISDLSVAWFRQPGVSIFSGNDWSSNIQWIAKYGIGYYHASYHPFNPRCYLLPEGLTGHRTPDPHVGMSDWTDCAFYQAFGTFFGYPPYDRNGVARISFGGEVTSIDFATEDGLHPPLPGMDLACIKKDYGGRGCKPILKSINNYPGTDEEGPLGTYVTRFDEDLNLEVYRHLIEGKIIIIDSILLFEQEPIRL